MANRNMVFSPTDGVENTTTYPSKPASGAAARQQVQRGIGNQLRDHMNQYVSMQYTDTGAANAYAVTMASTVTAYNAGMKLSFIAVNANTGASTLNVTPSGGAALGVKTIKKKGTEDLASGDIVAGQIVEVEYDGTNFQLLSPVSSVAPTEGIYRQAIIDGSCQVAQGADATLSTTYQYGKVDLVKCKATGTVGAGTITQGTAIGKKLKSVKFSGVTLSGGSEAVFAKVFIEAKDAVAYKNQTASFQFKGIHDVGSSLNATVTINKANSSDNFSAVTNIATSGNLAIPNNTETLSKYENVSMGDCSNGIEIIIQLTTGAITTKNIEFTDFQLNLGDISLSFMPEEFSDVLIDVMRLFEKSYNYEVAPGTVTVVGALIVSAINTWYVSNQTVPFKVKKRANPTATVYNTQDGSINTVSEYDVGGAFIANKAAGLNTPSQYGGHIGSTAGNLVAGNMERFHFVADARF